MRIKVCGITQMEQLRQLESMSVDFAGIIFYEKSKRFIGHKLEGHASQIKVLPIKKVGVFVNAYAATIKKAVDTYGLAYVQLHGDETPDFCTELNDMVPVIKAFRIGRNENIEQQLKSYSAGCSYFLFDTDSKEYGGTGKKFNWSVLEHLDIQHPFFLSGGIGPEDVAAIRAFHHPAFFAIDVNSCFETAPGVKNLDKVKDFVAALK